MLRLKELQKSSKYTIDESAKNLNLPKSTYNNYLIGARQPDIETLIKLANYFNVSLDYLCDRQWDNKAYIEVWKLSEEQKANLYLIEKLSPKNNLRANGYLLGLFQEQQTSEC